MQRNVMGLVLVAWSLTLVGCEEKNLSDLTKYIAEVKAKPKSAIEPLPEIKVVEPFLFDANGLRDPFVQINESSQRALADNNDGGGIKPDPLHQKEELEQYPLDSLKMVGTVSLDSVLWALVTVNEEASDKTKKLATIHRVQVGNYLGLNYGKISRITADKIELVEIVPDKPGTWREQEQTLPLVLAE